MTQKHHTILQSHSPGTTWLLDQAVRPRSTSPPWICIGEALKFFQNAQTIENFQLAAYGAWLHRPTAPLFGVSSAFRYPAQNPGANKVEPRVLYKKKDRLFSAPTSARSVA